MTYILIAVWGGVVVCLTLAAAATRADHRAKRTREEADRLYRHVMAELDTNTRAMETAQLHASIRLAITDDGGTVFDLTPAGLYLLAGESRPGQLSQVYQRGPIAVHIGRARPGAPFGMGE